MVLTLRGIRNQVIWRDDQLLTQTRRPCQFIIFRGDALLLFDLITNQRMPANTPASTNNERGPVTDGAVS